MPLSVIVTAVAVTCAVGVASAVGVGGGAVASFVGATVAVADGCAAADA